MKTDIKPWIAQRIVHFFNTVEKPVDIVSGVEDDPGDSEKQTFTLQLARRVLQTRDALPGRRFTEIAQIDAIPGVGPDKMDDLEFTFGTPAAEALERSLFDTGLLLENWTLLRYEWQLETQEEYRAIVDDAEQFRETVLRLAVRAAMETNGFTDEEALRACASIRTAYVDAYTNSTEEASIAFALWFYRFDADNWFTFDEMQALMADYFAYHAWPFANMELRLFKGFDNHAFFSLITSTDLAVTVNDAEQVITLWVVGLAD